MIKISNRESDRKSAKNRMPWVNWNNIDLYMV